MKKLKLTNPEISDVSFKISRFPDGQQTIDIDPRDRDDNNSVRIDARLNNFKDLELIICANQALRGVGFKDIHLFTPYFLGARSDRKFQDGGINYLKQVICPIINSQEFSSVLVMDPHSDVLEACLDNFKKVDNHILVKYALSQIDNKNGAQDRICLVSPDAGAYKKIFDIAAKFQIENIITATKVRDLKTGNIIRTEIPLLEQHKDLKYVIVDDICDGGRTFLELAKVIKTQHPSAEVYLVVTHGIFTNGLLGLSKWIDRIFTTNSFGDASAEEISEYTVGNSYLDKFGVI